MGARTLSVLGDRIYALAVMWLAWGKFGAGAMGLVAVAESVPYIEVGAWSTGSRRSRGWPGLM